MKKEEDLRVRRTYKLLSDALVGLMQKKPFEKISVKDICNEAMVHRTTFYTHFEDKYDLLRYCMKEIDTPFYEVDIKEPNFKGYKEYYMTVAKNILQNVFENKTFFEMIIKKNKAESFLTSIQDELTKKIEEKLQTCKDNGIKLPMPIQLLSSIYSSSCMSAICWWLENDMPFSVDELLNYMDKMIQPLMHENIIS